MEQGIDRDTRGRIGRVRRRVVALVAVTLLASACTPAMPATPPPAPTSSPVALSSPTAAAGSFDVAWKAGAIGPAGSATFITDVKWLGGRFVAIGMGVNGGADTTASPTLDVKGLVLASADGSAWQPVGSPIESGMFMAAGITPAGSLVVTGGRLCLLPGSCPGATTATALWIENGGGWTAVDNPGGDGVAFDRLASGPTGIVASGTGGSSLDGSGPFGAGLWFSSDGRQWRKGIGVPALNDISGVASTPFGFVAIGTVMDLSPRGTSTTTLLVSRDGRAWQPVTGQGAPIGVKLAVVLGTTSGALVAAEDGTIWLTEDGTTWTRREATVLSGATIMAGASSPAGVLLVGAKGSGDGAGWSSPDGIRWRRTSPLDAAGGSVGAVVALSPAAAVAVSADRRGSTAGAATGWTGAVVAASDAISEASPVPLPTASPRPPQHAWLTVAGSKRPYLGNPGDVLFVDAGGMDAMPGDPGSVVAVAPGGAPRTIATITPQPLGGTASWMPADGSATVLSDRGFLLVPMQEIDTATGEPSASSHDAYWLYDLTDTLIPPRVVPGDLGDSVEWGPDARLLFGRGSRFTIYDAVTGTSKPLEIPAGVEVIFGWTADGKGVYARHDGDAGWDGLATGVLRLDGTYHPGSVPPPYSGTRFQDGKGATLDVQATGSGTGRRLSVVPRRTTATAVTWYTWTAPVSEDDPQATSWDAALRGAWLIDRRGADARLIHLDGPGRSRVVATLPLGSTSADADASLVDLTRDDRYVLVQVTGPGAGWYRITTATGEVAWLDTGGSPDAVWPLGWGGAPSK